MAKHTQQTLKQGIPASALSELARLAVSEPLRSGPDRETFIWEAPGGVSRIVKRYDSRRWREALRERLAGQDPRSPGRREYETLLELEQAGVSVPRPIACHEEGALSLVVMELLEPLVSLRDRLQQNPELAAQSFEPVLELVQRFHGAGWYHRDLYLDHLVLVGEPERLALIDLERARRDRHPRRRWFIKDLAALLVSTPDEVEPRLCLRFLSRWLDHHGVQGRRIRRRWLHAVQAKARRMAAHVPHGGTSYPPKQS
ncbi:MAG: tRNA A-37 threonylcarbamoyl transferase component Bud32 [Gammaproteobacteria bacterium]|jgi:tRNA A-37 threonylcarbamoyl transferase component Bud32